jgi:hypothetical protein
MPWCVLYYYHDERRIDIQSNPSQRATNIYYAY